MMIKTGRLIFPLTLDLSLLILISCNSKNQSVSSETIAQLQLKRGDIVTCGPPDKQFGLVDFETSCPERVRKDFNLGIALLHSFEYDEAEKVFAKIIDEQPECAMAYWGVAMCNNHPLWAPPTETELKKGADAIAIAQSIKKISAREAGYIEAMASFYRDRATLDHHSRCVRYEKAMETMYKEYPGDKEIAIFYALALDASADPADKSYVNQKKAGAILTTLYPGEPNHPGIVHYIIHTYDYPSLAALALPAARKYASIAPSSAHAQHMPSHIFTRLGLWDECISSNLLSTASAKCYAESAGIKGHWDEELHGMDYLVYSYLQKGENRLAGEQCEYLKTISSVYPVNFKDAYAFAAIPARYVLENKQWDDACRLQLHPSNFPWKNFPWQEAIFHFAKLLGFAHMGRLDSARNELNNLRVIYDTLIGQKDPYKANQVQIQIKSSEAWILYKEGKSRDAIKLMTEAARLEDKTEKSAVTPCEVIPAWELLADLFFETKDYKNALAAYQADIENHPNRFNAVFGAASAAGKINDLDQETRYFAMLVEFANSADASRPELEIARSFLKK